jgi:hypothetical protein
LQSRRVTQKKGDIGVTQAIATFTRMGYDVAIPITESAAYDLIIDDGDRLYRVQVRYCGRRHVELRRIHSNSQGYQVKLPKENAYDWLYVLRNTGEEYLIKRCVSDQTSITLKEEYRIKHGSDPAG